MGCGPSLIQQRQYMDALANEDTFCCNRMMLWDGLPFVPTYYGVTEPFNAENLHRYEKLTTAHWPCPDPIRFVVHPEPVDYDGWIWVEKEQDSGSLQMQRHGLAGLQDDLEPLKTGRHSPLTLSQIAIWMGYREIIFIGIDFSPVGYVFDVNADPGQTATHRARQGAAAAHKMANAAFTEAGGQFWDCTSPQAMPVPYKPIEELLGVKTI